MRYADDFIVTGRSKALLEEEVKPLIEEFMLRGRQKINPIFAGLSWV
jgi:RNA-directed DNA polymerase